jgi:carbon monoxide dehydrogenase subunit G
MRLEKQSTIRAEPSKVWAWLWDIPKLIEYMPGVEDVEPVEEGKHYSVRINDRVGPFPVRFNLDVVVESIDQNKFLRAHVSGKDQRFASTLRQVIEIQLRDEPPNGTDLSISTEISILGKLGSLGDALIRSRAAEAISNFVTSLKNDVESGQAAK